MWGDILTCGPACPNPRVHLWMNPNTFFTLLHIFQVGSCHQTWNNKHRLLLLDTVLLFMHVVERELFCTEVLFLAALSEILIHSFHHQLQIYISSTNNTYLQHKNGLVLLWNFWFPQRKKWDRKSGRKWNGDVNGMVFEDSWLPVMISAVDVSDSSKVRSRESAEMDVPH